MKCVVYDLQTLSPYFSNKVKSQFFEYKFSPWPSFVYVYIYFTLSKIAWLYGSVKLQVIFIWDDKSPTFAHFHQTKLIVSQSVHCSYSNVIFIIAVFLLQYYFEFQYTHKCIYKKVASPQMSCVLPPVTNIMSVVLLNQWYWKKE